MDSSRFECDHNLLLALPASDSHTAASRDTAHPKLTTQLHGWLGLSDHVGGYAYYTYVGWAAFGIRVMEMETQDGDSLGEVSSASWANAEVIGEQACAVSCNPGLRESVARLSIAPVVRDSTLPPT